MDGRTDAMLKHTINGTRVQKHVDVLPNLIASSNLNCMTRPPLIAESGNTDERLTDFVISFRWINQEIRDGVATQAGAWTGESSQNHGWANVRRWFLLTVKPQIAVTAFCLFDLQIF